MHEHGIVTRRENACCDAGIPRHSGLDWNAHLDVKQCFHINDEIS
jgi:hypothetical protein